MVSSQESTNSPAGAAPSQTGVSAQQTDKLSPRAALVIFAIALALRLWFNFGTDHINAAAACDASEYIRYTAALSNLVASHQFGPQWKEFVITGPSFPIFLWLSSFCWTNFQSLATAPANWTLITANSAASALTALIISLLANRLWNRRTAYVAAVMAILYPGFIVNSGRLYSETFATCIETLAIWLACRVCSKDKSALENLGLGAVLIMLQLTRSSMIILSGLALPFSFLAKTGKNRLPSLATTLAGMALVLVPWLIFEKTAFDKMSLIVDRVGHYNLFIGTNTNTMGFLAYPYPDGRGIEEKSFFTLTKEAFKTSPSRFLRLCLDKPARLYKFPWNDFRTSIGPISPSLQTVFHQLILLAALLGIALALIPGATTATDAAGRLIVFSTWLINLPFLAFITVPRYNLMAMPAVIILAAAALDILLKHVHKNRALAVSAIAALFLFFYLRDEISNLNLGDAGSLYFVQGVDHLSRGIISALAAATVFTGTFIALKSLSASKTEILAARAMTVLLGILAVILTALPQRANGRPGEGIISIDRPDVKISGHIPVKLGRPGADETGGLWLLAVDGENLLSSATLKLNGEMLSAPIPALAAIDDWTKMKVNDDASYLECSYIFDCLCQPGATTNSDLRQWLYYPLTSAQIKDIAARGALDISLENKTFTQLFTAAADGKEVILPGQNSYSWEKAFYGVENDSGFSDPRFDEKAETRQAQWRVGQKKIGEEKDGEKKDSQKNHGEAIPADLNIRLVHYRDSLPLEAGPDMSTETGSSEHRLALRGEDLKEGETILLTISVSQSGMTTAKTRPELYLRWTEKGEKERKLSLPWTKAGSFTVSLPLDLRNIPDFNQGNRFEAVCKTDKEAKVSMRRNTIGHLFYGRQEVY